ncbi:hypothetical protein ACFL3A_08225 [Pseudomonadota bacterium]
MKVYIQSNERQWLGALVSAYSMKRNSAHPEAFDVEIMHVRDYPFLAEKEGQTFLRGGTSRVWSMKDLQSFTPLRFMPPKLMAHEGRAVVVDPDVFALGDVYELLTRDMQGTGVMGRHRSGKQEKAWQIATSVMLMDCEKLRHWEPEKEFDELFQFKRDYKDWIVLRDESPDNIGVLEDEWNDFDRLTENTRMLHNTKRRTQPWKTGLPVDFTPADKLKKYPVLAKLNHLRSRIFGEYGLLGHYHAHPDPKQEQLFFGLVRECLEQGIISESLIQDEMRQNHVRHDALQVVERTPPLAA